MIWLDKHGWPVHTMSGCYVMTLIRRVLATRRVVHARCYYCKRHIHWWQAIVRWPDGQGTYQPLYAHDECYRLGPPADDV